MVQIAGGKAGSVKRLKKDMESSSGGKTWIRNVREGEDLTVRFLAEPEEWFSYREHYDPDIHFFPCIGKNNDCPGCNHSSDKVQRASRRYLAPAIDVTVGEVIPLKLPLDLANRLVARYERYGDTIMDRDYTLHRMGKGLDTTYDVSPEEKSKVDTSRYEMPDLEQALLEQFEDAHDLEDEEEEKPKKRTSRKATSRREPEVDEDDDVDTDDDIPSESSDSPDEDEDDDEGYLTEEQALEMSKKDLVDLAERVGAEIDKRWSKKRMVDAIFAAAE